MVRKKLIMFINRILDSFGLSVVSRINADEFKFSIDQYINDAKPNIKKAMIYAVFEDEYVDQRYKIKESAFASTGDMRSLQLIANSILASIIHNIGDRYRRAVSGKIIDIGFKSYEDKLIGSYYDYLEFDKIIREEYKEYNLCEEVCNG